VVAEKPQPEQEDIRRGILVGEAVQGLGSGRFFIELQQRMSFGASSETMRQA